jgi:hypothetical protein
MTSTSSQTNITVRKGLCLYDLPKDIINNIGLFVNIKNISTILMINKRLNDFKYSLKSIPYYYLSFATDLESTKSTFLEIVF